MLQKIHTSTKLLLVLLVFILQGALSACGSSSSNDSDDPQVSSDSSKVFVTQTGAVTVSGVIVDAVKRTLISGATVTIRVDGNNYSVTSAPTGHASPGSFAFLLTPGDSEYFITVSTSATYAPFFYANTTPKISTSSGGIGTQDIGSVEMYNAIDTTVSVKNISGGAAITGLTLYYDTKDVAETNSTQTVSISGLDIVATETAGVYSFPLPDNGVDYEIKIKDLVDDTDVAYDPYNATITDDVLTNLQAGNSSSYYFKASNTKEFTIFIHLVDENGDAFDAGEVLVLNETGGNDAIFAERKASTTNEYVLTVTAPSPITTPSLALFDYTILNLDLDGDDIYDTATAQLTALDESTNILNGGSFDVNREATVVVPISMLTADQNIAAELISDNDKFQVNGTAEVIIAFDRPVEIVHDMRMSSLSLNTLTVTKGTELTADLFQTDQTTTAQLEVGTGANTVTRNITTLNIYDYVEDDGVTAATVVIPDTDATTGEVTSPYETEYDSVRSIDPVLTTAYVFSASNTLLTITLDSSTLKADHVYTFEFAVRGTLSDTPVAFITKNITAKSDATITEVADLWVDDFDFVDTPTIDVTLVTPDTPLTNQTTHIPRYVALPSATYNAAGDIPLAEYLTPTVLTLSDFDAMTANSVYIVSPAKLSGTVEVVSQTETFLNATTSASDTEILTNLASFYGLDYSSNSGIATGDVDLTNLTNIASDAKYLVSLPSNHGIDESGLKEIYAGVLEDTAGEIADTTTVVTSGADNITTDGIYYTYKIPLNTSQGGHISSVTLDFNVSVNGVNITGSMVYPVQ